MSAQHLEVAFVEVAHAHTRHIHWEPELPLDPTASERQAPNVKRRREHDTTVAAPSGSGTDST